ASDTVHPGGHPGALRDLLGLTVEEFLPLGEGERVHLVDSSNDAPGGGTCTADVWAEAVTPLGAVPVLSYADGPAAGGPAVTRPRPGRGHAWYVSTRLCGADLEPVLRRACADAGLAHRTEVPSGVELVRRIGADAAYLIAINHLDTDVAVPLDGAS